MACVGMRIVSIGDRRVSICGGATEEILRRSATLSGDHLRRRWRSPRMCVVNLGGVRVGAAVDAALQLSLSDVSPKLDQLMKESVTEIVKNINDAPFLVQAYSEDVSGDRNLSSSTTPLRLVIEKATSESWSFIQQRWEGGNSTPDGVILVEELGSADSALVTDNEEMASSDSSCCTSKERAPPSSAKVWGLLVQGRELSYPACYILKTCQVQCCFGFSTHFSLAKVDCFGQDLDFHLKKLWLQR